MVAISSTAGLSQEGLWVVELKSALKTRESKLQMLSGVASENSTLRAEANRLRAPAETFGSVKRIFVMPTKDIPNLASRSKMI